MASALHDSLAAVSGAADSGGRRRWRRLGAGGGGGGAERRRRGLGQAENFNAGMNGVIGPAGLDDSVGFGQIGSPDRSGR